MSWPSYAVSGGGAQNSNRFAPKCRTNSDEFRPNLEEIRSDERNSEDILMKFIFRGKLNLFRGNLDII
jgi:hypothetical protein